MIDIFYYNLDLVVYYYLNYEMLIQYHILFVQNIVNTQKNVFIFLSLIINCISIISFNTLL